MPSLLGSAHGDTLISNPVTFRVGLIVEHKVWGRGKIVHTDDRHLWVYFKDVEGTQKQAVKQLAREVVVLAIPEKQSDTALDNLPPIVQDGKVIVPERPRVTEAQALNIFITRYRRFDDPGYMLHKRDYKWEAHLAVESRCSAKPGVV